MTVLEKIYRQVLDESKVSQNKIDTAMDNHKLVVIRYNTHGERVAMANRLCGVFAYGVTKAGNECLRVFEYKGDTTTFVPGWKLIRLDRIISWYETNKTFNSPPLNTGVGEFNPNGDGSMSLVFKIAKFDELEKTPAKSIAPKKQKGIAVPKHGDGIQTQSKDTRVGLDPKYAGKPLRKTDTELAMDYLRKQLENPEKIDLSKLQPKSGNEEPSGLKQGGGDEENAINEPTQANPTLQKPISPNGIDPKYAGKPLRKTDTELAMDYLRKQLENPEKIDLSKLQPRNKGTNRIEKGDEVNAQQGVVQAEPVLQKPITPTGIDPKYSGKPIRKTDTETAMDYLRKQLENPVKIDLSKIPKK